MCNEKLYNLYPSPSIFTQISPTFRQVAYRVHKREWSNGNGILITKLEGETNTGANFMSLTQLTKSCLLSQLFNWSRSSLILRSLRAQNNVHKCLQFFHIRLQLNTLPLLGEFYLYTSSFRVLYHKFRRYFFFPLSGDQLLSSRLDHTKNTG